MISTATVAQSIIAALKADAGVVGALYPTGATEVREESWMGTDYVYPCVRVYVTRLSPTGESGICRDSAFDCDFNVSFRAANPSSKPAADGVALVVAALAGKKLTGSGFVARSAVHLQDVAGPVPESEHEWMARAFFNCQLQEV